MIHLFLNPGNKRIYFWAIIWHYLQYPIKWVTDNMEEFNAQIPVDYKTWYVVWIFFTRFHFVGYVDNHCKAQFQTLISSLSAILERKSLPHTIAIGITGHVIDLETKKLQRFINIRSTLTGGSSTFYVSVYEWKRSVFKMIWIQKKNSCDHWTM